MQLWPHSKFEFHTTFLRISPDVESFFESLYKGTHAAFFSSARSGIFHILKATKLTREEHLWLPPFSSHCLTNTVSLVTTPTDRELKESSRHLIYHQWGFPFLLPPPLSKNVIIEDSVDSLVTCKTKLFPNNGDFEVFSLPKIIGSPYGGVVVSSSLDLIKEIRHLRDKGLRLGHTHHIRRLFASRDEKAKYLWSNTEPLNGPLPRWIKAATFDKLKQWDNITNDRKIKLNLLSRFSLVPPSNNFGRLPVCIPLENNEFNKESIENIFGESICQTLIKWKKNELITKKCLPVPIHQNISLEKITKLTKRIKSYGN